MSKWSKIPFKQGRRTEDDELCIIVRERASSGMVWALSAAAYRFLAGIKGTPVAPNLRVDVLHDEEQGGRYAVGLDAEGVSIRPGHSIGASRLRSILGLHVREGGYRIPLTPDGDVLAFEWPPEDMRTVVLPKVAS